jgi:3-phosphoshikimate 1-carboxyvinyltransferase
VTEIIPPSSKLAGSVQLPGSKSITNRALLLAALAEGKSEIRNALESDDSRFMSEGLGKFGVKIEKPEANIFEVWGNGGKFEESSEPIYLGNAGTATRFLTAASTLIIGETVITGNERMQHRPIQDLIDALEQLGAKIESNDGCPPLQIVSTGKLTGKTIKIRGDVSSQFVSALLMVLPYASEEIELKIEGDLASRGYVRITTAVMNAFGVIPFSIDEGYRVPIKNYSPTVFEVEPDASSATYFWAAKKLVPAAAGIEIANAPKNWIQPDARSREIMERFPEPFGTVQGERFPDAVPTLAVLAAFAGGESRFTGIKNLRVKECDRIVAVVTELNKIKAGLAEEDGDDLIIHGDRDLAQNGKGTEIETYNDHRIAMSFFLAGLKIPGIKIRNPDCVAKSFPNFWKVWENLGVKFKKINA